MTGRSGQRLLPILFALLFCIAASGSRASDSGKSVAEKYDAPIRKYEKNIQKLQSGIEIHLGKLQVSGEKEFTLLGDIEGIDKKLALQKVRLEVMEERLNSQQELLLVKIRDLKDAEINRDKITRHLQERLRAYYLMGRTGILNVTFSTRTLPELMLFNDSYQTLLAYDRDLVNHYRETIVQLVAARDAHEKESALLDQYIKAARDEKIALDTTRKEKNKLLQRVKSEKGLYEQALNEMKSAELDLLNSLKELQEEKKYILQGFVMNKGKLAPPVAGRILKKFGAPVGDGKDPASTALGITIEAKDGAPLQAIFAGKVIFAGYRRGYGNMVIIDHGMDYYSVTSRMEKVMVREGDIIDEGAIIGKAGDTATLFEKGLYFEIRHETEPVDPLEWLAKDNLAGL